MEEALGDGCDVLVDMVAFGRDHAAQLTGLAARVGSAVVISSGAVYEDGRGRSFDTQDEPDGFPEYPVPIRESQRTVAPGEATYGTRKVALEQELLAAGDALPVTLLRAGAVHGPHCRTPRELYFVKRLLDGRRRRVLAYGGKSRFHPVHVSNLAELIRLAALRPASRVLNAGIRRCRPSPRSAPLWTPCWAWRPARCWWRGPRPREASGRRRGAARTPSSKTCRPPNGSWATAR